MRKASPLPGVYQRGRSRPARAPGRVIRAVDGVYQRGRSRPARAKVDFRLAACSSVSKRPFPTSQSYPGQQATAPEECIKEAVPDQPELSAVHFARSVECIKEAVPDQPERRISWNSTWMRVYQRGRSRPARAEVSVLLHHHASVSKRPFPTSQSLGGDVYIRRAECIKEAVPDQPEPANESNGIPGGVYQRGRSRPARADAPAAIHNTGVYQRGRSRPARAIARHHPGRTRVYQRGRSRPARA